MTEEQKAFALHTTKQCATRDSWLRVINFGRAALLQEPDFLLRLIVDRAELESVRQPQPVSHLTQELFSMLNLTIRARSKESDADVVIKR